MSPPLSMLGAMPSRLGSYELRAKIAEGGMATVWLARGLPGTVALKVIKDELALNKEFVDMFTDEAKIVSRLHHPNVVQIYELGMDGHRLFLAMELLVGQSLWSVWEACRKRGVRLRYDLVAWIGARIAEGLHHAHELRDASGNLQNIVHRDVNASNVFVTYDGEVKIIDFGLAKAANRVSRTAAGVVKGKLAYMSPEQATGAVLDRRTDIFALGVTLWELTVDRRLFKGKDDLTTLRAVHEARVPDPTGLVAGYPRPLWRVLRRALARERDARYPTAAEMARDLDSCSRIEGRELTSLQLAEVVRALFQDEYERQAAWIAEASAPESDAPRDTLRPPSADMTQPPPRGHQTFTAPAPAGAFAPSEESKTVVTNAWSRVVAPTLAAIIVLLGFALAAALVWKMLRG